MNYEKLEKQLKKKLDDSRYTHTLGVAYTCTCLAMRYNYDIDRAYLAGLLHDCAKCIDNDKKIELCEKNHIEITEIERKNPFLLHAKLGSLLAKKKYHIQDEAILSAIRWHTTGHPDMTMLEKIVFVADYIEPNRKKQPNLTEVRHLCFENLDQGLKRILSDTLVYLNSKEDPIDEMTQMTYDYYNEKDGNKNE